MTPMIFSCAKIYLRDSIIIDWDSHWDKLSTTRLVLISSFDGLSMSMFFVMFALRCSQW